MAGRALRGAAVVSAKDRIQPFPAAEPTKWDRRTALGFRGYRAEKLGRVSVKLLFSLDKRS